MNWGKMRNLGKLLPIGVALAIGLTACGGETAPEVPPQSTVTVTVSPPPSTSAEGTSTAQPNEQESPHDALVKSLEIKTGQSDIETAKAVVELESKWMMAGATQDAYDNMSTSVTVEQEAQRIADEQAAAYTEAMFGIAPNDDMAQLAENLKTVNYNNLWRYLSTADGGKYNAKNLEAWESHYEFTSLDEATESNGEKQYTIRYIDHNNGNKNLIGDQIVSGEEITMFVTLQESGDHYEVSASKID